MIEFLAVIGEFNAEISHHPPIKSGPDEAG
jgi:hypothetical protein